MNTIERPEFSQCTETVDQSTDSEQWLAPVYRLTPDRIPKPILKCQFAKEEDIPGWLLIDTGAASSMINEQALTPSNHTIAGKRSQTYYGAGGSELPLGDNLVHVRLHIDGVGEMVAKNVIVCKGNKGVNTMLLGGPDIRKYGLVLDYSKGIITFSFGNLKGKRVRMPTVKALKANNVQLAEALDRNDRNDRPEITEPLIRMFESLVCMISPSSSENSESPPSSLSSSQETENLETIEKIDKKDISETIDASKTSDPALPDDPDKILNDHKISSDGFSNVPTCGDPCIYEKFECKGCEKCIDEKLKTAIENGDHDRPPAMDNPQIDAKTALLAYMERLRQRQRESFTHKDCTIDPKMAKKHPKLAKSIEKLIEKHKSVFANDIGCLGPEYAVQGTMKASKVSPQRPGHSKVEGLNLIAMVKKFAELAANGVIVPCHEVGVTPVNRLMALPVKKKDDDGNVLEVLNALRIVIDSRPANGQTQFCANRTDNLNEGLSFAMKTSVDGFNAKVDVRNAFFIIPLHKSLWKYFCVDIPILGLYCFTRVVQGWGPAAQICMDVLTRVFFPIAMYIRKYMDDIIFATKKCEKTYIEKLDQFFTICQQNGIRLKGSKCFFLTQEFNYLGFRVSEGKLKASPHYVLRLKATTIEKLITKGNLYSFIMSVRFLARFQNRSTDLLYILNNACKGSLKEKLVWTDELRNEFKKVMRALDELAELHPFDPLLPSVIVVDTSKTATGGFLYQNGPQGPRLVSFFSRTRRDKERKTPLSSCHMEILGLKAMVCALYELLRQSKTTVTIVTDSRAVVKVFEKYRKSELPSNDTVLNNALYTIVSTVDVNVVHARNTNMNIKFTDDMSRLGLFVESTTCEGAPKCTICAAADPDSDVGARVINAIEENIGYGMSDTVFEVTDYEEMGLPIDQKIFQIKPSYEYQIENDIEKNGKWTVNQARPFRTKYRLREFLENTRLIKELQSKDDTLRILRRELDNGRVSFPKSQQKLQTLLENREARVENDIITIEKVIDGVSYRVVPLPKSAADIAIGAAHNTMGHASGNQLYRLVQRHFSFEGLKDRAKWFSDQCARCVLHRGSGHYRKLNQKPVPIPDRLYETILVDEVTRTFQGQTFKFFLAMEAISGFIMVVVYDKNMSAELFIQILAHVKTVLCPHIHDAVKMTVRCDQASWHTSGALKIALKQLNIDLMLHSSTTNSKNIVPELDSRIKVYSQYLVQLTESSPYSIPVCCHLAAAKTNNTIGKLGRTPSELFTGRGWRDGKQLNIDITKVIDEIKKKREDRRLYDDRKMAERFQQKELKFIPYSDESLNSPLVNNPAIVKIKIGDRLTLKEGCDKNEPRYIYRVLDIDFRMKTVKIVKESNNETGTPKPRVVSFSLINKIFPKSALFAKFDGYDREIHCSYPEWDNFVANIDKARLKILPCNLNNQPDMHYSLLAMVNSTESEKYIGHTINSIELYVD